MALYKTSSDIIVKNWRLFSSIATKARQSWTKSIDELPMVQMLKTTPHLNNKQWTNLRKEILDANTRIKTSFLDVTIIQLCGASKNVQLAKCYLQYLLDNKYELNTAIIGKYFQLLYHCKDFLKDDNKKEFLTMYDNLRLKHSLLDASTAESCILVISLTERWKEGVELLEMIGMSCTASVLSYTAMITAAFNNGEPEIGWKIFREIAAKNKKPYSNAYIACINYCSKNYKESNKCVKELEKLFNFMADNDIIPDIVVVEHIKSVFHKFGWVGNFTKLSNAGVCHTCDHKLQSLKLSDEDFSYLSKTILDKVIIGDNIYFKSTPIEVKRFVNFVDKTRPYHVVIDGLNVGYMTKKYTPGIAAKQLASVVRYFLDKHQVVLVLGRRHMMRWDQKIMNYIKNNSFLFLTDDLSADDPCLLYATLASGPEANFVSSDLMRQHKFKLQDPALGRMFKQWQLSHQCFAHFNRDKLTITPPLSYSPSCQGDENHWHIPYEIKTSENLPAESYEPPSDWLCLKRVIVNCK